MTFIMQLVRRLIGLVVDDGVIAICALAAVGAGWLLTRDWMIGATSAAGFVMFGMLAASLIVSVVRAAARSRENTHRTAHPPAGGQPD
jgi:hypothetical protein